MKDKKNVRTESAVSPVIGVLLMLVVTIIIAAIVSGFAGGLAGGTQKAPQASISAKIVDRGDGLGNTNKSIEFKLLSGDSLPTKDLAILTYFTNSSGYVYKNEQTASSDLIDLYNGTTYEGYGYNTRVPYLSNIAKGYATSSQQHFGNFTWVVGDLMGTGTIAGTKDLLNMTKLDSDFKTGSVVDIKIKHVPSNKFIFDKEVTVE